MSIFKNVLSIIFTCEKKIVIQVRKQAIKAVKERGGNIADETEVLSEYVLQFGAFRGQTFRWMLENAMGYSAWLVDSMHKETVTAAPLSQNKASFKAFVESFEECRQVIAKKRADREEKEKRLLAPTSATSTTRHPAVSSSTVSSLAPLVLGQTSPRGLSAKVARIVNKSRCTPNLPASTRPAKSRELDMKKTEEEELCNIVDKVEQELGNYKLCYYHHYYRHYCYYYSYYV